MTKIEEQIRYDFQADLKAGRREAAEARRYLLSLLQKQALRQEKGLTEEMALAILQKELKAKQEARGMFLKAGRQDLLENEEREIAVLKKYLPAELSDGEIKKVIAAAMAAGQTDFGSLMKAVMAKVKGRADGRRVAELVREALKDEGSDK